MEGLLPPESCERRLMMKEGDSGPEGNCKTFIFHNESHTLGNTLRTMLLHNPQVTFAGYTIPHPSEDIMHLRVQTIEGYLPQAALCQAFVDLKSMVTLTKSKFQDAFDEYDSKKSDTKLNKL
uniref:DNA-directed RNA polymerase I subunit D n=1 Tax=Pseudodiaptomus poplesia TaxID=213370 RepID=A0A1S6GLH5_9MAXI|nr:DNA-directed RNA polymerases I and III subunit rpac2 [Pseudodiaptomus poplesia]